MIHQTSNTFSSDWSLIDVNPQVFANWDAIDEFLLFSFGIGIVFHTTDSDEEDLDPLHLMLIIYCVF